MYDNLFDVFVKYVNCVAACNNGKTFLKKLREDLTEEEHYYIDAVGGEAFEHYRKYLDKMNKSMS